MTGEIMGTVEPGGTPIATSGIPAVNGGTPTSAGGIPATISGTAPVAGGTAERLSGTGMFGAELKAQRMKRGWTQAELGRKLDRYSDSYVSDIERVAKPPTLDFARKCDKVFDLPGTFGRLYAIVKRAEEYPAWFESVVVPFEVGASRINGWELGTMPGLLQTEDYARALIRVSRHDSADEEVDRLVAVRMGRQGIFAGPTPPRVWYVIDEAAFRRVVGGTAVMAVQLDKLIAVASIPGNVIQVFPFTASRGLGGDGPLTIFEFPENHPVVGYAECYRGGRLVQDPTEGSEMLTKLNLIRASALSPRDSVAWMRTLRSDLASE
jgi:transcriptional regulator with XRE-family HTH domain